MNKKNITFIKMEDKIVSLNLLNKHFYNKLIYRGKYKCNNRFKIPLLDKFDSLSKYYSLNSFLEKIKKGHGFNFRTFVFRKKFNDKYSFTTDIIFFSNSFKNLTFYFNKILFCLNKMNILDIKHFLTINNLKIKKIKNIVKIIKSNISSVKPVLLKFKPLINRIKFFKNIMKKINVLLNTLNFLNLKAKKLKNLFSKFKINISHYTVLNNKIKRFIIKLKTLKKDNFKYKFYFKKLILLKKKIKELTKILLLLKLIKDKIKILKEKIFRIKNLKAKIKLIKQKINILNLEKSYLKKLFYKKNLLFLKIKRLKINVNFLKMDSFGKFLFILKPVKGGYRCLFNGLIGFLPNSHFRWSFRILNLCSNFELSHKFNILNQDPYSYLYILRLYILKVKIIVFSKGNKKSKKNLKGSKKLLKSNIYSNYIFLSGST